MIWYVAYLGLLAVLFVRFQDPQAPRRRVPPPGAEEPLALVTWHHRLVYGVLLAAPVEVLLLGPWPIGRLVGLVLMGAGVALYRWGARALGDALSPFLSPVEGAALVRRGPYALVRHPMYLGQMMLVLGAPLLLGARLTLGLAVVTVAVVGRRMAREDELLAERLVGYREYAASTKRLVPWIL